MIHKNKSNLHKNRNNLRQKRNTPRSSNLNLPNSVAAPPPYIGMKKNATYSVLRHYLKRNIYVWLKDNNYSFWVYPIRLGKDILYGYIWDNYKWTYSNIYLKKIRYFY